MQELSIIQKTYDLIKWYTPILNRLPRDQKMLLGFRITNRLYDFLEGLLAARYTKQKLPLLEPLNTSLDILRYQARLLVDTCDLSPERYEIISEFLNDIGTELGGWIRQQNQKNNANSDVKNTQVSPILIKKDKT